MAVKRFSTSFISDSGQDKSSNFIANYSPAIDEMELIERVRVGSGGTSAIEFTNIPATYQHLQIRGVLRGTRNAAQTNLKVQINGDTGSNYAWHTLRGSGSAAAAFAGATQTAGAIGDATVPAATSTASVFNGVVLDILDYALSSKTTTLRMFSGFDANGSGYVCLGSTLWSSTNAVTSLTLSPSDNDFAQHSTLALYGVKA